MSYWVAVVARNAEPQIGKTLNSLLQQSVPPTRVVTVNDGSSDRTGQILEILARKHGHIFNVITLPDQGYDIRRVPRNINMASTLARKLQTDTDFLLISGDDCVYPRRYARSLIDRMNRDDRLAVASGTPNGGGGADVDSPSGSGRIIRMSFWNEIGSRYPIKAGWETWILYRAVQKGYRNRLFRGIHYGHLRPRGAAHQFMYWGAGMYTLGYLTAYALGRVAKNVITRGAGFRGSMNMLRGYVSAPMLAGDPYISAFDGVFRAFVRQRQAAMIATLLSRVLP